MSVTFEDTKTEPAKIANVLGRNGFPVEGRPVFTRLPEKGEARDVQPPAPK